MTDLAELGRALAPLTALPQAAIAAALRAGAAMLPLYHAGTAARDKADGSPVTQADELAEAIITEALTELAPLIPIVAEEAVAAGRTPATDGRFFLVDPLDGTREFINGHGDFTVNIALIDNAAPIFGLIYAPAMNELYVGVPGAGAIAATVTEGAVHDWTSIAVRPAPWAISVVASRSHLTPETEAFVNRFVVESFVSRGSSLKFCQVARGAADLYPRLGRTMEWDIAAGDAILRAAGGMVTTLDGAPMRYGKRHQAHDADFANPHFVAWGGLAPQPAAQPA